MLLLFVTFIFLAIISSFILIFEASEEEIEERASQWDQPVVEYIDLAEKYLGFQQPGSVYGYSDAGGGCKRVVF